MSPLATFVNCELEQCFPETINKIAAVNWLSISNGIFLENSNCQIAKQLPNLHIKLYTLDLAEQKLRRNNGN